MAFEEINSSEIQPGKPLKAELFSKIKNSLDDLDARLEGVDIATVTSTNTLAIQAAFTYVQLGDTSAGAITTTLPSAVDMEGKTLAFKKITSDAYSFTVDAYGSETIDGSATWEIPAQYDAVAMISDGTNWHVKSHIRDSELVFTTRTINTTAPLTGGGTLDGDLTLSVNALTNSDIDASAGIVYSKLDLSDSIVNADINSSAAIEHDKMEALTGSRAVVTDGDGYLTTSSVTSTEIAYCAGLSSAVQTQLNEKADRYGSEEEKSVLNASWGAGPYSLEDINGTATTYSAFVLVSQHIDATVDDHYTAWLLINRNAAGTYTVQQIAFEGDTNHVGASGANITWSMSGSTLQYSISGSTPAGFSDTTTYLRYWITHSSFS